MRNKKVIAVSLLICALVSIGVASAAIGLSDSERAMKEAGESLQNDAQSVISGEDRVIAVINGEDVTETEMQLKIQMYALTEKDANDAWHGMKLVALEKAFAREHGLLPTEEEVMEYTKQLRSACEEVQESADHVAALASGLGMTLDEYWYEYRVVYEIPTLMIRERVNEYIEDNNLSALDPSDAQCTIIDKAFFQSKGINVDYLD